MRIMELMTKPAITCGRNETLNRAAQLMWDHDIGFLPVVGDDGRLAGIVTDRDVCMAAFTQGVSLSEIPVTKAMAKNALSCRSEDLIETAERRMQENQIRRVPIVDEAGRPIGILSMNDIVREAARSRRKEGTEHGVLKTLAAIGQRRRPAPRLAEPKPKPLLVAAR